MIISLYTSRVILHQLGIENFGIYNLVGGVVILFSFLNNAMTSATQRFINIEIASKLASKVNKIFNVSLSVHFLISGLVLLLSETIGLWFLNNKLNIPIGREYAANIVYQLSILTTIINILRIPFNALILAKEKMSFYAYLGIFESILKLIIVFSLSLFITYDQLIVYAVLLLIINILINIVFKVYSVINFKEETKFILYKDKKILKELLSFSGWSLFGQIAVLSSTQGVNMILNIFVGVTVNAALGIANQVNSVLYNFVTNMQVAFNPQIIQSHASNELDKHRNLILNTSKYSVYLFLIISLPFLLHTEYVLKLWLGDTLPKFVVNFTQLVILNSIINAMVGPFWMSANAIGNIRNYQIGVSTILLFNLPLAYLFLKLNFSPVYVMAISIVLNFITFIYRLIYINSKLKFNKIIILNYFKQVISVISLIIIVIILLNTYINNKTNIISVICSTCIIEIILILSICLIGINNSELKFLKKLLIKKIKND